jgi:hypothetical protein
VDPKALKLGVSKLKNLANNALFVECNNTTDRDILDKELGNIRAVTMERPKRKLPFKITQERSLCGVCLFSVV